jgi:hypothetical protein
MTLSFRGLLPSLAAAAMAAAGLPLSASAYDLQYRQNNTSFSAIDLQRIFNQGLPQAYDQVFPEQQWTTYLLLDSHPDKGQVAITLGLSPRVGATRALLPIATYSVIEPIPSTTPQWQRLLSGLARAYANSVLSNQARLLNQR